MRRVIKSFALLTAFLVSLTGVTGALAQDPPDNTDQGTVSIVVVDGGLTVAVTAGSFSNVFHTGGDSEGSITISASDNSGALAGWYVTAGIGVFDGPGSSDFSANLEMQFPTITPNGPVAPSPIPFLTSGGDMVQVLALSSDQYQGNTSWSAVYPSIVEVPAATPGTYNATITVDIFGGAAP